MQRLVWLIFLWCLSCSVWAAKNFQPFQPLPEHAPVPADNPQTTAKISLGRQLYFDPRLSFTGRLSCNDCHNLAEGGEDGRSVSTGALGASGSRSAPTLWNVAFQTIYFWDGRAHSLEEAIGGELFNSTVMAMPTKATLVGRFYGIEGYRRQFAEIFGDRGAVSLKHITAVLATYIRTLVTPNGPFDRYLRGDEQAIPDTAKEGFKAYIETGCASCHFWVNLAGPVPGLAFRMGEGFYELFPNFRGSPYDEQYHLLEDLGRFLVTGEPSDRHMWRVPSLRNVADTAPYFHNGSVATLEEAVRVMARTELDKDLDVRQMADIVAFLRTLSGEVPPQQAPLLP